MFYFKFSIHADLNEIIVWHRSNLSFNHDMRKEYNKIKNFSKVCSLRHPTISLCWNIDEFSEKTTTNLNGNLIFEQANLILITPTGSEQNVNFCTWLVNIYSYYLLSIKKNEIISTQYEYVYIWPTFVNKGKKCN